MIDAFETHHSVDLKNPQSIEAAIADSDECITYYERRIGELIHEQWEILAHVIEFGHTEDERKALAQIRFDLKEAKKTIYLQRQFKVQLSMVDGTVRS